jgi:diaminopimelate epimerase
VPELSFAKGQALGNDYLVVAAADLPWPLTPARVRALCDRHRGAGADGLLLVDTTAKPFRLRIYNPDGGEAEKSGNGLRILAAYLHGRGLVNADPFAVRLSGESVTMQVGDRLHGGALDVMVEMGRASFRGVDVGFGPEAGEALGHELTLEGGETAVVHPVSVGNPHCVVLVDALRREDFLRRSPQLSTHAAFINGTNVQFVRATGPAHLEVWIWERGAGETLASGSSACAAAAVAVRLGLVPAGPLTVSMPGGEVEVAVSEDYEIRLRGAAEIVYAGRLEPEVVRVWGEL